MNTNKQPANWFKSYELSNDVTMSVSSGGAIKLEREGKMLVCIPAKQLETLHLIFTSLDPELIQSVMAEAAHAKEVTKTKKYVEREVTKVAGNAAKYLQALQDIAKAQGVDANIFLAKALGEKAG